MILGFASGPRKKLLSTFMLFFFLLMYRKAEDDRCRSIPGREKGSRR
jgi:hypothetical protein